MLVEATNQWDPSFTFPLITALYENQVGNLDCLAFAMASHGAERFLSSLL
jgi:hypothetical protein